MNLSKPGKKEYLSPNLLGLQNLATSFLSWRLIFVNIIDAFREVVNGVRYEILLNAIDTQQNNTEPSYVVCRLVILEKPWLYTSWATKIRELVYSNCSSESDNSNLEFYSNEKYQLNAIFSDKNRQNRTISSEDLSKLDEQIIPKEKSAALRDNNELVKNNTDYYNNNNKVMFATETVSYLGDHNSNFANVDTNTDVSEHGEHEATYSGMGYKTALEIPISKSSNDNKANVVEQQVKSTIKIIQEISIHL